MPDYLLDASALWDLLQRRVELTPDARMLIEPDGTCWTFRDFGQHAERVAAELHARGIGSGTPVTWQMPTGVEAVLLSIALARLGAIQNPLIHLYGKKEISAILKQNRSSVYIVPAPVFGERDYVDVAKSVLATLAVGPKLLAFDRGMARDDITTSGGSTAHYLAFLNEQRKHPEAPLVPTLRLLSGGGAPKPPELYFRVQRELGCTTAHSYGMTEAPMIAAASPRDTDEQLAYSDGEPVSGLEIKIVRADACRATIPSTRYSNSSYVNALRPPPETL